MTTFAEFSAQHLLTASELSELVYALAIIRKGCGTVNGKEFPNAELLHRLREESRKQESFGAIYMSEVLDCAANVCLAKFASDYERDKYRRERGR